MTGNADAQGGAPLDVEVEPLSRGLVLLAPPQVRMDARFVDLKLVGRPPRRRRSSRSIERGATALTDQAVVTTLAELGATPAPAADVTPEAHRQKLQEQMDLWAPIIKEAGVTAGG